MSETSPLRISTPDILTCIANLSSDAVFTPPALVNQMLDTLEVAWAKNNDGANIWEDAHITFLDPFTKSGVFLREIVRRLVDGLEKEIPDLQSRVDHILSKQVFGIATETLTAHLSRRTVYCSKWANGKHSITQVFDEPPGNIWFERTEHTWVNRKKVQRVNPTTAVTEMVEDIGTGRCKYCGASEAEYARSEDLESHAYAFIHTDNVEARLAELFGENMKFDVIIGNPPYQLGSDGGTRDVPIYQKFVAQAKKLEPRMLAMVIQSRWMTSGLGLREFRQEMLSEHRLRKLVDYPNSDDVFPGTGFRGGACYFLWDASYDGLCSVTTIRGTEVFGPVERKLDEYDVFVRDARAVTILRKVLEKNESSIKTILSADKEFGWTSNFDGFHQVEKPDDVPLYYVRGGKRLVGYIARKDVMKSAALIDTAKVLVPKAGSGGGTVPDYVLSTPMVVPSPSTCTQTFLFFHVRDTDEAHNLKAYLSTKFARFLISLRKITQDATKSTYTWVPMQSWDHMWTDEELFEKYGVSEEEQSFISSQIREVSWGENE